MNDEIKPSMRACQNDGAKARLSPWAIASLVASVPGFLFGLSIFGIIFGIVSLYSIHRGKGQLTGRSLAVAGIVLGLVGGFFYYSLMLSDILEARAAHHRIECKKNMETLIGSLQQYAFSHNGDLPARKDWKNALSPYLPPKTKVFFCPEETRKMESYIYLGDSGMKITDELWTQGVPLIYESRVRHTRKCGNTLGIGFVDGKVERIEKNDLESLIQIYK